MILNDIDVLLDEEFDVMTREQTVLYLARGGISPLDCEASLARAMKLLVEKHKERR